MNKNKYLYKNCGRRELLAALASVLAAPLISFAQQQPNIGCQPFIPPVTGGTTADGTAVWTKHRLPTIYSASDYVDAGGLISYGVSYPDLYRRAATYADKIFKGANPGDIPIERPIRFEVAINMKTAKTLGIKFPPTVLVRADRVIE